MPLSTKQCCLLVTLQCIKISLSLNDINLNFVELIVQKTNRI